MINFQKATHAECHLLITPKLSNLFRLFRCENIQGGATRLSFLPNCREFCFSRVGLILKVEAKVKKVSENCKSIPDYQKHAQKDEQGADDELGSEAVFA